MQQRCALITEVYSRIAGYYRPVKQWNKGKQEEFRLRKEYVVKPEHLGLRRKEVPCSER